MKNISEHIDSLIVHKNKNKNNKSLKKYKNYLKNTNKKVKNKKVKKTKKISKFILTFSYIIRVGEYACIIIINTVNIIFVSNFLLDDKNII